MKNLLFALIIFSLSTFTVAAQDKKTGGVKGSVHLITNDGKIAGVTVEAKQNGKTIASARTNDKGDFQINNLPAGIYRFTFNKTGLSEGTSGDVQVKSGTIITLKNLRMNVDKGDLALVRGSVFTPEGLGARGAKVEIYKISSDNTRKIGERFTDEAGEFAVRLPAGNYRLTASTNKNTEPVSKDFEFTGGQSFDIAVTLKAKQ